MVTKNGTDGAGYSRYSYLSEKVREATSRTKPYKHYVIEDFLSTEDLAEVLEDKRTKIKRAADDREVIKNLEKMGYKASWLPGSTQHAEAYLNQREGKGITDKNSTCEGIGMAFALKGQEAGEANYGVQSLVEYLRADEFWNTLLKKCRINGKDKRKYVAYTKYLDGHELAPHTDSRHKPITFLLNLNSPDLALPKESNTRIMELKPEYRYIAEYWKYNESSDRCWLPWSWCKTIDIHEKNNSLLIIPASNTSFHGIRLNYCHLKAQRSMIYGSAWGEEAKQYECPTWEDLRIEASCKRQINGDTCMHTRKS